MVAYAFAVYGGPVGWLAFIGIIWALFSFFLAMMRAIILYLFIMVGWHFY
ncbi:putative membrane protein [Anaplasma phagocytophilum str. CRT53-1]|uniref:Putative membrane protein n=1 Tax=Anaplasma phagocytophilum str. CRT53-1 TaxID=1359157 RepID=A0A0F3Q4B5_ANAPH|nr:putative membrane protein [Anaplasma phagocytophilum str. CRT53-1]